MDRKKVAIIGAGISGLVACKHALEKGLSPVVFEATSRIGGIWWSQTIQSTKLQTPKAYFQFSDFPWPRSVTESFPSHHKVLEYINAYALHFDLLPHIKFDSKVISIDYESNGSYDNDVAVDDDSKWLSGQSLWGGTDEAFSSCAAKWNVVVQQASQPSSQPQVYEVDFVVICIGRFNDLPNIPEYPVGEGPEVFKGKAIHSSEYAAMDYNRAAEFTKNKRITVIGSSKSAVDIATEISKRNGAQHPVTLLHKTSHWMFPEYMVTFMFCTLNRFFELMLHKPSNGYYSWLLAIFLAPLLWVYSKLVESYVKLIYPLKKYDMVPELGFSKQLYSCFFLMVAPPKFFDKLKEKSLLLKKFSNSLRFCRDGLIVDANKEKPLAADVVIFATGFKGEEKLKDIFSSTYFQKCIITSSAPLYRECIHPRIPQLAILGYVSSSSVLYTVEMRSKWLMQYLAGGFRLPPVREMEEEVAKWEEGMRRQVGDAYKKGCAGGVLQIHFNDQMCMDMKRSPRRKSWFFSELFASYDPSDYAGL